MGIIGQTFYDTNRTKQVIKTVCNIDDRRSVCITEHGDFLVLFEKTSYKDEYEERIKWCQDNQARLSGLKIVIPKSYLINCPEGKFGYCFSSNKTHFLEELTKPDLTEKRYRWYFNLTGGISNRLKISYILGKALMNLHKRQILAGNISPQNILINSLNGSDNNFSVELILAESISTYSNIQINREKSKYTDPMISSGIAAPSTYSDVFSFAVVLFELLTSRNPFVQNEESKLSYIFDKCNQEEYEDEIEEIATLLPAELRRLFDLEFGECLYTTQNRPSLKDFTSACIKSLYHIVACENPACAKEFSYSGNYICPFCLKKSSETISLSISKETFQDKKILMPYDSNISETPLPSIIEAHNYFILKPGNNYISSSTFTDNVLFFGDRRCLAIQVDYSKKKYRVFNLMEKIPVQIVYKANTKMIRSTANSEKLIPCQKGAQPQPSSEISFDDAVEIRFPNNLEFSDQSIHELFCEEYGSIKTRWFLTIAKGAEYEQ